MDCVEKAAWSMGRGHVQRMQGSMHKSVQTEHAHSVQGSMQERIKKACQEHVKRVCTKHAAKTKQTA